MVAGGLLAAIRARVAARGMTFTDLARASGMQPGNLRRMLTSTTASPRLGSVMRLLPPLHARIAPAGARTATELAAFLEDQQRRSALPWDQLLGLTGLLTPVRIRSAAPTRSGGDSSPVEDRMASFAAARPGLGQVFVGIGRTR